MKHFFQMLRLMKGYDEYNTILLPPRPPGEKLPPELLEFYEGNVFLYKFSYIMCIIGLFTLIMLNNCLIVK
jgi:hypothetical protein